MAVCKLVMIGRLLNYRKPLANHLPAQRILFQDPRFQVIRRFGGKAMKLFVRATEQDGKRIFFSKQFRDMALRNSQTSAMKCMTNQQPCKNESDQRPERPDGHGVKPLRPKDLRKQQDECDAEKLEGVGLFAENAADEFAEGAAGGLVGERLLEFF